MTMYTVTVVQSAKSFCRKIQGDLADYLSKSRRIGYFNFNNLPAFTGLVQSAVGKHSVGKESGLILPYNDSGLLSSSTEERGKAGS